MNEGGTEDTGDTFNSKCSTFAFDPNNADMEMDLCAPSIPPTKLQIQQKKHPSLWKTEEVALFLEQVFEGDAKLTEYIEVFRSNDIDGEILLELKNQELKEDLGISSFGHRKKLLNAIRELKQNEDTLTDESVKFGERLGYGSFSSVYAAIYRGTRVAVKCIQLENKRAQEKIKEEVEILSQLDCPHIVQYYTHVNKDREFWILMECMTRSLHSLILDRVEQNKRLHIDEMEICAINIAKGLFYLHNRRSPIIHRDLKSKNVLINLGINDRIQACKICDFGISKITEDSLAETKIGTLRWTAPEVLLGESAYSLCVDIWSYGMVLFELIEMKAPYSQIAQEEVANIIREGRPPNIPQESRQMYPKYCDLVDKCANPNPSARPTAGDIVEILQPSQPDKKKETESDIPSRDHTYAKKFCVLISPSAIHPESQKHLQLLSGALLEKEWNVRTFFNETATLSAVQHYLNLLNYQTSPDDCLLILFSGEITQDESHNHLLFYDYFQDKNLSRSITTDTLINHYGKRVQR